VFFYVHKLLDEAHFLFCEGTERETFIQASLSSGPITNLISLNC